MQSVHVVRVSTESGEPQIWLAATDRDEAIDRVLKAAPEGSTASLIQRPLGADNIAALNMKNGEIRQHQTS
jgi:hypothetical protein